MAVLYTPHFMQFFDNNGDPLNGGLLYTYQAGTTTPKNTFTDSTGATPNANPVVLDASGRAVIFIDGSYKFRLETSTGSLIRETDNVSSFEVASFATGAINWASADTLASSSTVNIGSATSNYIIITGTTTITAFDAIAQGAERLIRFSGALTLTHNATSLIIPGGANITTQAGDIARFISEGGGNWRMTQFQPASSMLAKVSDTPTITPWVSYTPTFTAMGTVTGVSMWWRRVGDTLELRGNWTNGTVTASEARVSLPSGLTSDATKVPALQVCGHFALNQNGSAYLVTLIESNVAYITFGRQATGENSLTKTAGTNLSTGISISILAQIPITGW